MPSAEPRQVAMNFPRLTALLFVGLTLLTSGCSSLRPPPADPSAWNGTQIPPGKAQTQGEAWADALYYALYDIVPGFVH